MGERNIKKGYSSLDVGHHQKIDLIQVLSREHENTSRICKLFGIQRSSYQYRVKHKEVINPERERLKQKAIEIHATSRGATGARIISGQLKQQGEKVGRYKARNLMREANISSKQPPNHKYKVAKEVSNIAPNLLQREFVVDPPNKVWCGDVTYIWAGTQWLYLAVVMDLYARRIVGWACSDSPDSELTCAALRMAYESRCKPKGVMYCIISICTTTSSEDIVTIIIYRQLRQKIMFNSHVSVQIYLTTILRRNCQRQRSPLTNFT